MGYGETISLCPLDVPQLSSVNTCNDADTSNALIPLQPKKLCKQCKLKHTDDIRRIPPSTDSTPFYTQFQRKKPCSCSKEEWKAYRMFYFTTKPYYSSDPSEYLHVIEIRLQCGACNSKFPVSITLAPKYVKYHFGEYMKIDTWIFTASLDLKYERVILGFFKSYDYLDGLVEKAKKNKNNKMRFNKRIYALDCWYHILLTKSEIEIEIIPDEECECFNEKKKDYKHVIATIGAKEKLLKNEEEPENSKPEKEEPLAIEAILSEDGSECCYVIKEKKKYYEERDPEEAEKDAKEVVPEEDESECYLKKRKNIQAEMKKLKMLIKLFWPNYIKELKEAKEKKAKKKFLYI